MKLPELRPWMLIVAAGGAAVAFAWASGGAKVRLNIGGTAPNGGPDLLPWGSDHGCCEVTWPKIGRHSKTYPAQVGPNINALMNGHPINMGMGLTSWMAAPPSEETT